MTWLAGLVHLFPMLLPCVLAMLTIVSLFQCGGSKSKKAKKSEKEVTFTDPAKTNGAETSGGSQPRAPEKKDAVAGTHDPNYQTLAAVPGGCFGADKKGASTAGANGGPKAPTTGGGGAAPMAGTHDPNYQTLAGVGGDCFGADKKAGGGAAPAAGGGGGAAKPAAPMAGTHDPNYQTLAGIGGDCFGADKKGGAGGGGVPAKPPAKPPAAGGQAATHDPNYQTLAGIGGNECFGQDKKK